MAGREHHAPHELADLEAVALVKQPVPLRAVSRQVWPVVEILPELLDIRNARADGCRGTCLLLEIVSGREVIGMGMGVEDPLHGQPLARHIGEDLVGLMRSGRPGFLIELIDRIDDRAAPRLRVGDDILDAAGTRLVEALHLRHPDRIAGKPLHRAREVEAVRPTEGLNLAGLHPPGQYLAQHVQRQ